MKAQLRDHKNWFTYAFWSMVKHLAVHNHFSKVEIVGREHIPTDGAFLLVSNHVSRWDGLVVYNMIGRPTNFMVSPNELLGFQGSVLVNMGSFPADPRYDLQRHVERQFNKGEGVVIFPEGDVYRDDTTHNFKPGAARLALSAAAGGLDVPVLPCAIHYTEGGRVARLLVAPPVEISSYVDDFKVEPAKTSRALTERLHREVSHLRASLGSLGDKAKLLTCDMSKSWLKLAT